jgi:hypothetical protein
MRGMRLSRPHRSAVSLVTAVLLLLCQAAFAAQACSAGFVAKQNTDIAPCHETIPNSSNVPDNPAAVSVCEASKAVAESAKHSMLAVTDLPALPVAYADFVPFAPKARPVQTIAVVCHSPPLTALHCRYLN